MTTRASIRFVAAALAAGALALPTAGRCATHLYVIAVGNNTPPRDVTAAPAAPLLYADDDAAAMVSFTAQFAHHTTLLTVMDAETRRLYPELLAAAVPPTLAELRRTIAWHRSQIENDRRTGDESVVLFFFSGHGTLPSPVGDAAALTMIDGPLTRSFLYDELLAALPARYVHLVIDACHAEAVVRPRGADLPLTDVSDDEARGALAQASLARFPNAGAIVAAARAKEAHEWDRIQHGVFTYELLSALRGGADVNQDGRIEYSEVFAFVAAANHGVDSIRAAPDVRVYPPPVNPRAELVDLSRAARTPRLHGDGASATSLRIEDDRGAAVASVHAEAGSAFTLAVPADRTLYLRRADGQETAVRLAPAERLSLAGLTWAKPRTRTRNALDASLERGLFATPFGLVYYRGFVDARPDLLPVSLTLAARDQAAGWSSPPRFAPSTYAFAGAALLAVTSGIFTVAALDARHDFDATPFQREAADALHRMHVYRGLAIASGVAAAGAAGLGLYLKLRVTPVVGADARGAGAGLVLSGSW